MAEQRSDFTVVVSGGPGGPDSYGVASQARTTAEFTSAANMRRLKEAFGQRLGCSPNQLTITVDAENSTPNPRAPGMAVYSAQTTT